MFKSKTRRHVISTAAIALVGFLYAGPAHAQLDISGDGIGVDLGDVSVDIGGGGGNVASVGVGDTADVSVTADSSGVDVNIGGAGVGGINESIGTGLGNLSISSGGGIGSGGNTNINLSLGGGLLPPTWPPGKPPVSQPPTGGPNPRVVIRTFLGLSGSERTRYRRRCYDVLAAPRRYDVELVYLCRVIKAYRG